MSGYDAIILAGGQAKRLGGVDKPSIDIAGSPMLERVLRACSGARAVVIVGPPRPTSRPVTWTLEDPPYGGPLAGLSAGLGVLPADSDQVLLLAADLPYLTADHVAQLLKQLPGHDAAVFVDAAGVAQPLAGAYRAPALRNAVRAGGDPRGRPVRRIVDDLHTVTVPDHGATGDCDTADQVATAREALRRK